MSGARHWEQDKDSTLYVGNLDERCTDALVWELMAQAGPVINVHLPKDRVTQIHQGYGFVEFSSEEDADYAAKIMNQIRVHGKPIRVNKASADKRGGPGDVGGGGSAGVGAEIFVGNLDTLVDEKVLFETFSRFGPLVAPPKVARDESNLSKGYGFVSYASFEASDDAIANMHGQYLMNKEITVQYAYKKDGKGERHGDAAERALAAQAKAHGMEVAIPAMPAALVMSSAPPPSAVPDFSSAMAPPRAPQPPPGYPLGPFPGGWPAAGAPPGGAMPPMPPVPMPVAAVGGGGRQYTQSPLQAAPGLPARPPPSTAGYGGPVNAPGMNPAFSGAPGFLPQNAPPGMPPGLPPGLPPGMPPGMPMPGASNPAMMGGFRPPNLPNGFPPPPGHPR